MITRLKDKKTPRDSFESNYLKSNANNIPETPQKQTDKDIEHNNE